MVLALLPIQIRFIASRCWPVVPLCLVSPALGMARGALQTFKEQACRPHHARRGSGRQQQDDPIFVTVQMRVAEATASIDAATLMIHRDIADTVTATAAGGAGVSLRMRNRLTH